MEDVDSILEMLRPKRARDEMLWNSEENKGKSRRSYSGSKSNRIHVTPSTADGDSETLDRSSIEGARDETFV